MTFSFVVARVCVLVLLGYCSQSVTLTTRASFPGSCLLQARSGEA